MGMGTDGVGTVWDGTRFVMRGGMAMNTCPPMSLSKDDDDDDDDVPLPLENFLPVPRTFVCPGFVRSAFNLHQRRKAIRPAASARCTAGETKA